MCAERRFLNGERERGESARSWHDLGTGMWGTRRISYLWLLLMKLKLLCRCQKVRPCLLPGSSFFLVRAPIKAL